MFGRIRYVHKALLTVIELPCSTLFWIQPVPVSVIVQFTVLPASLAVFQNIMETVKAGLPRIPGCQAVTVMQDLENPCRFSLVEVWESQASHAAHVEGLIADGTWAGIASHLEAQPNSGYFRAL